MSKVYDRVLIVMFENQYRNYVMQDAFMEKLARAGASMNNYFGCFHPSQTNYIASLAGEVCAVTNDDPPTKPLLQQTLVNLLEEKSVSWKAYMEAYPGEKWKPAWKNPIYPSCDQPLQEYPADGETLARYFRKHNAFASFHDIQSSKTRWSKIVPSDQLWNDIAPSCESSLPEYSWFTPDIWNDGHYLYNTHVDTNPRTKLVSQLSAWLEYVFLGDIAASNVQEGGVSGQTNLGLNLDIDLLLTDPVKAWEQSRVPKGTLLVVTFDEADYDAQGYDTNYDGPNQIYTVLLGDMIKPNTNIDVPYNHYSLIKTVEKNFDLGSLQKNDKAANWFRFLWQQEWSWGASSITPVTSSKAIAAATLKDELWIATVTEAGVLNLVLSNQKESLTENSHIQCQGNIAMGQINDGLCIVYTDSKGSLNSVIFSVETGWSQPVDTGVMAHQAFAMCEYIDIADENTAKLMLCWQPSTGEIKSKSYSNTGWQTASDNVGQITDGEMAIAQLGGSLLLVYKQRNKRKMCMTTYNVAPFNAFKAKAFNGDSANENNTSLHQWSPADEVVGHFADKMSAIQDTYQSTGQLAMAAIEGEVHLAYRDTYADTPQVYTTYFGLTGIFTAESQQTNGYGTMQQAGWTSEEKLKGVEIKPDSQLCMASNNTTVWLLWQPDEDSVIECIQGKY